VAFLIAQPQQCDEPQRVDEVAQGVPRRLHLECDEHGSGDPLDRDLVDDRQGTTHPSRYEHRFVVGEEQAAYVDAAG
jgi:hypothetical protein